MKEYQDYAIRTWGFEDPATIELFQMIEWGSTKEAIERYIAIVDASIADDRMGFED